LNDHQHPKIPNHESHFCFPFLLCFFCLIINIQADYFNSQTESTVKFIVGGSFPASGQFEDWAVLVKDQPMPIRVELSPLQYLVSSTYFPDMDAAALNEKQAALQQALLNYCLTKVAEGALVDCNPPPPDAPPPPQSVFGGMYQYDPCGTKDQLVNPYTGGMSCAAGFTHVWVGEGYSPDTGCAVSIFLCLLSEAGKSDPLNFFGGMFQSEDLDDQGQVNPFTGAFSCPDGFEAHMAGRILKSDSSQGTVLWVCANPNTNYAHNPFGGAYQVSPNGEATKPNWLTGADSCPPGYTAYQYGRITEPEPQSNRKGADLYMCLNNILPTQ
jgi:hypothetical protein